jgi:hypothetical protein
MTEESASTGFSRRKFLIGAGGVAGGLALAGGFGGALGNLTLGQQAGVRIAAAQNLKTDLDILQFALTLEHFENAAYAAANQSGLLTGQAADLFKAFGEHEAAHVAALTDVITKMGATPVAAQNKYYLPNLQTSDQIVDLFIQLEEVGAGAYLGAAPMIQDKALLSAAASIHDVEAQHASSLKALKSDPMPSPAFGAPLSYDEVIMAVTPFLTAPAAPPEGGYYTNTNPAPSLAVAVNRIDAVTAAGVLYYPETGHSLSGPFADYFNANGNLMQFGFPITEPYMGTNQTDNKQYVQQFFQRARMEWHPENKGTPFEVELGLLGAEQLFKSMMGGM